MKLPIFLLVFLFYGCMPYGTDIPLMSEHVLADNDTKAATLDENGMIAIDKAKEHQGFLTTIKNTITKGASKLLSLLGIDNKISPFCQAIRQESPTAADFVKNWAPDNEHLYCPGTDDQSSCKKKHDDAFQKGLLCYQGP